MSKTAQEILFPQIVNFGFRIAPRSRAVWEGTPLADMIILLLEGTKWEWYIRHNSSSFELRRDWMSNEFAVFGDEEEGEGTEKEGWWEIFCAYESDTVYDSNGWTITDSEGYAKHKNGRIHITLIYNRNYDLRTTGTVTCIYTDVKLTPTMRGLEWIHSFLQAEDPFTLVPKKTINITVRAKVGVNIYTYDQWKALKRKPK